MREAYTISARSKDTRTKIGAVLVKDKEVISQGYNGPPRGLKDDVQSRLERPNKYFWFEHGERNAIFNCARRGQATMDTQLYTMGVPCACCARAAIQAGVKEIIVHNMWQQHEKQIYREKWEESLKVSSEMLLEAGVKISVFEGTLGVKTILDGKIIEV